MFSTDERARLAALHEYGLVDTPPEAAFDRITALAAEIFGTPIAAITLIDADRQWIKSIVGLEPGGTPREDAFCHYTIESDEVTEVLDPEGDARFRDNPFVTDDPNIRFYAGAPLQLASGHRLGALCVIDQRPRAPLTAEEKRRLKALAQIVVNEMDLRLLAARSELLTRQAQAATEAKSEFLANMTHELLTPLTSVIGFNGLLAASPNLPERERMLATKAKSAGEKLLTIVNDVLDLARLEADGAGLNDESIDIGQTARSAIELFAERAQDKGVALVLEIGPDLPTVRGDAARLRQILVNLLGNALKFTQAGEVSLRIAARDGGLALAVGDITVESTPGEGSTFTVTLPEAAVWRTNTGDFGMDIREADLGEARTQDLLRLHLAGMHANSPPGHVFALDLSGLRAPGVSVWSAWSGETIIGIGALKRLDDGTGEVKSMRTHPDHLRKGVAAALLERVIDEARAQGLNRLSLETGSGPAFDAALSLYRRRGFVDGEAFGDYVASDFNQFLHLAL
ncbi:GNAT family N-acetyltransferase [Caulobacter hibisci]|uniref:histidine kinase n=1 Tax=Caulobacter hibisci TaxID=2035993 RepID=A0ABS0SWP9_9CAUL|nr:GNAT family N-acetyltransferase [Caulobacter hibisci]MBI1683949.1 GNAT family N-acetyltransferase [Caulobacter hibisci]